MGTSSDRGAGTGGAWTPLKHAATSYARAASRGATSPASARRVLSLYPAVLGGAGAAAASAQTGRRGISGLGGFLAGVGISGLGTTLDRLGFGELVGKDRFDVLDAIVTAFTGAGSDVESQAARDALCDVLDELFGDATTWEEISSVPVTAETLQELLALFLSHYIYNRLPVLPERLARTMSPENAKLADADALRLIAGLVEFHMPTDPLTFDWTGPAGRDFAAQTLSDAYDVLEGEAEHS